MCQLCDATAPRQPSRRSFLAAACGAAAGLALGPQAFAKETKRPPKPQNVLSPDAALDRLVKGNARYVEGVSRRHDFRHEREALAGGQNPFAGILGCADSRIAPEYAFDCGRGDLFVCRVAGNFASDEMVASLEYAVNALNVPLFMVLGHDSCGAVDATIKSLKDNSTLPGHLPELVSAIAPAVKATEGKPGDRLANAIRQNVIDNITKLKSATPILNAAVDQGKLKVVGGIYRLGHGKVELIV
ncbi:carbonic anhydrase [Bradyrhizobium jicamae]|uniref:Carbonic anhydrase n=1 Tax=Bradyrhizobium jicamae TaxID=280332 RepID=A0ABS5FI60_9BRAD|nr:carbonic anhydrase [Bradyrhizobium jicamae]MBR0796450.1 carbonic anhydrase [Bradyrhizobium jicamae]MBR0937448.1 carbonic anhydrase [Bradyrhizobium jicamae]